MKNLLVFGNTQITTQAISCLMDQGIDIVYLTTGGRIKARTCSKRGRNVVMRIAHYGNWFDPQKKLAIAKQIVEQKLVNQIEVLTRYQYSRKKESFGKAIAEMKQSLLKLPGANTPGEVIGLEGNAAASYFNTFVDILPKYEFTGRQRRPAYDPVNAMLNLTYAFLMNEIATVAECDSFDLQLGFLHEIRSGRNSLVLDLMEPYRPIFADRFVFDLLNNRKIQRKDFESSEEGMRLLPETMKEFCKWCQQYLYQERYEGKIWKQRIETDILYFREKLLGKERG